MFYFFTAMQPSNQEKMYGASQASDDMNYQARQHPVDNLWAKQNQP